MNARSFFVSITGAALLALVSGCAAESSGGSGAAQDASEDLSSAPTTTQLKDNVALHNASFESMRTFWNGTQFANADIQGATAFTFAKAPAMTDAQALVLAKAIAKTAKYKEVNQYVLNAQGTSAQLEHLAGALEQQIRATDDDTNTPKLTAAMLKAFSLPGQKPGGAIKVFVGIGPGDDHDYDNQDREAIFVDTEDGEAVVLQGQSIDM